MDTIIRNAFLSSMKFAIADAERCYKYVFGDEHISRNELAALSYAATSLSYCLAAESLFYSHYDDLDHPELPQLFHQFKTFVHEVQSNYGTDHSHQWSGIEYDTLKELFDDSICTQPILE